MRRVLVAASLVALFGMTACDSKPDVAEAPPPPKSMARSQQMYAGQEQVSVVGAAAISVDGAGVLSMTAAGEVPAPGYKNPSFLPRINAAPPKDGVYEVDVVADRPDGAAPAVTPIEVKGAWSPYPADRLKGVKFIAKTNSVVAMLPPG